MHQGLLVKRYKVYNACAITSLIFYFIFLAMCMFLISVCVNKLYYSDTYLQPISVLCVGFSNMIRPLWFAHHDSPERLGYQAVRWTMKVLHKDLCWQVIYHQYLHRRAINETAVCLFTSASFVSNICRLYRERSEVNRQRRRGRQIILSST